MGSALPAWAEVSSSIRKRLAHKWMRYFWHRDTVFHLALIFVFTPLGTKVYKDKVMGSTDQGQNLGSPGVPAVLFANWREVLHQSRLGEPTRAGYALAISGYLGYCRRNGLSLTTQSARGFMADVERRKLARNPGLWKRGLNWFFVEGRRRSAWTPGGEPTPGHERSEIQVRQPVR